MALRLVSILAFCVCSTATDVAADFEKACLPGQQECIENSEDMYLIQKHVEVSSTLDAEEDPTVTTKGGGGKKGEKKEGKKVDAEALCPLAPGYDANDLYINHYGYEQKIGYTPAEEIFGMDTQGMPSKAKKGKKGKSLLEKPKKKEEVSAEDLETCAFDCNNRTDCQSFQFDKKKATCYLNTHSTPSCNFEQKYEDIKEGCEQDKAEAYIYCAKIDPCTIQPNPFAYWNSTHSFERNMWNAWNTMHRCWIEYSAIVFFTWITWSILGVLAFQLFFNKEPEIFRDAGDPIECFENDHFFCNRREKICCCAFLCPAAQWADTMNLGGFIKPMPALGVFCFMGLLNAISNGAALCAIGVFTAILIVHFRQKLRAKLMLKHSTFSTYWNDAVYVCLCPCCAIAQEAMVVRYQLSKIRMEKEQSGKQFNSVYEARPIR